MKRLVTGVVLALSVLAPAVSASGKPAPPPAPVLTGGLFVPDSGGQSSVTADWTWGWVTGTIYLNRSETNKVAAGFGLAGIIGAVVSVGAVAAVYGTLSVYANYVYNEGRCLKFKIYPTFPYPLAIPGSYGPTNGHGWYCR